MWRIMSSANSEHFTFPDKPLARLIKKKGRRIKSIKLEMKIEKSQQTTQKYKGS